MKNPKLYSDSYQLTLMIFVSTKSFAKHLRPNLGRELELNSLNLTLGLRKSLIAKKNHRLSKLYGCSEYLDNLKILGQLSFDLKAISPKRFEELSTLSQEIGRELGGLIKFEANRK